MSKHLLKRAITSDLQVLYSKIEADRHFVGWTRVGDNIRYYKNDQMQVTAV